MELVALLIGAYFLGSVPVGVLVVRAHGKNIFEIGSGNIGATNVKRAIGTRGAVLVFLLDLLKGLAPRWLQGTSSRNVKNFGWRRGSPL